MKKMLTLCVAALSTSLWLPPTAAAVVGTSRHFLDGGRRKMDSSEAPTTMLARKVIAPLDDLLKKAQAEDALKAVAAAAMAATAGYTVGDIVSYAIKGDDGYEYVKVVITKINSDSTLMLKGLPELRKDGVWMASDKVYENVKMDRDVQKIQAPLPAPAPAPVPAPMPMPGPMAPMPSPAPMPDPIPPIPPCNWTYDWEEVARPAICVNMTNGFEERGEFDVRHVNHTCVRGDNMTFDDEIRPVDQGGCIPPPVQRCSNPTADGQFPTSWNSERFEPLYHILDVFDDVNEPPQAFDNSLKHGTEFHIACADNATAIDHRYALESWGQDWYPGTKEASGVCNNGTIIRMDPTNQTFYPGHPYYIPPGISPIGLRCVLKEKVKLTQDLISYLRWSEPKMHEAETKGYKWVDMVALNHKAWLKAAMAEASTIELAARDFGELREIVDLKRVITALKAQRMIPRGEPMTQETCKDLEKHWLYELENSDPFKKANMIGYANWVPPVDMTNGYPTSDDIKLKKSVGFDCSYTLHKSAAGADPYTNVMNWRYRDGCFCESRWIGGCPFKAENTPSYQTFGFDSVEVKGISTSMGAATNALCWYFTKPANPEWGYLRTNTGFHYQAPHTNVTELKHDWIKLRKLAQKARFKRR